LHAKTIDLYCRWLYQTARADGKPRVLLIGRENADSAPISLFINRLKQVIIVKATCWLKNTVFQDFLKATDSVSYFIRINLPKAFKPLEDICLDNDKTKERLLTKMKEEKWEVVLLISRYPLASTKKWIVENEKEVSNWDLSTVSRRTICLNQELKIVAI
jgi:hypothetical protein